MAGEGTGRGRNRGSRKRNNKRNKQPGGPKKPNVPPPAQTKLIWRNIGNTDKYGSVEKILNMVQNVLEISNQKNASQYNIEIDRSAVRSLIQEEELAQKYLEKFQAEIAEKEAREKNPSQEGKEVDQQEEDSNKGREEDVPPTEDPKTESKLDVVVAPKLPSSVPVITARPLYVIPPKRTRRRGVRGGCAYVLLTAPKVDKIDIPETLPETKVVQPPSSSSDSLETKPSSPDVAASSNAGSAGTEAPPTLIPEGEVDGKIESGSVASTKASVSSKPLPTVDYSSAVAKGRLLLSRAIDFLAGVAKEDAKGAQDYAGCSIEPAMSGKTWRPQYRTDRREGTIENTADYKNWLKSLAAQKEELSSRPKPTPGGGAVNNLVGLAEASNEPDQPVATLVQHLRAKRLEMKRKKGRKKKETNGASKGSKKKAGGGNARGGTPAAPAGTKKKKKKKKKAGKKKAPGGAPKGSSVAPTLLKPPNSGAAR
eukprot:scaffold2334_cov118-Cylindrotheca_fusiformis.AAC.6